VQAEAKVLRGPHEDLEMYLEAVDQLKSVNQFFTRNPKFKTTDQALSRVNNLLSKAISKLEDEFKQILTSYRLVTQMLFWIVLTLFVNCYLPY